MAGAAGVHHPPDRGRPARSAFPASAAVPTGDLLVYRTDGPSRRHVAMVVGPGRMVEARGRGVPVRWTRIRRDYLGAVRPGAGR